MIIADGTINDLIKNLWLIREKIPEKSGLDEAQVYARMVNREYGIKLAQEKDETIGIMVWYEINGFHIKKEHDKKDIYNAHDISDKALYLWLGALKTINKGIGTKMLKQIEHDTSYNIWYSKTSENNIPGLRSLYKIGFREYEQDGGIITLIRFIG